MIELMCDFVIQFNPNNMEANPGPQYFPKDKPELIRAAKYTFGYKRADGSGLINKTATPASVGPARYAPELQTGKSSLHPEKPRWTLPKAGRLEAEVKKFDKNQTYDTRSGFGKQQISKNKTTQKAHFGTSGREHMKKLGTFKDMMQGGASIKCHIPKW